MPSRALIGRNSVFVFDEVSPQFRCCTDGNIADPKTRSLVASLHGSVTQYKTAVKLKSRVESRGECINL